MPAEIVQEYLFYYTLSQKWTNHEKNFFQSWNNKSIEKSVEQGSLAENEKPD